MLPGCFLLFGCLLLGHFLELVTFYLLLEPNGEVQHFSGVFDSEPFGFCFCRILNFQGASGKGGILKGSPSGRVKVDLGCLVQHEMKGTRRCHWALIGFFEFVLLFFLPR